MFLHREQREKLTQEQGRGSGASSALLPLLSHAEHGIRNSFYQTTNWTWLWACNLAKKNTNPISPNAFVHRSGLHALVSPLGH